MLVKVLIHLVVFKLSRSDLKSSFLRRFAAKKKKTVLPFSIPSYYISKVRSNSFLCQYKVVILCVFVIKSLLNVLFEFEIGFMFLFNYLILSFIYSIYFNCSQ